VVLARILGTEMKISSPRGRDGWMNESQIGIFYWMDGWMNE
jgi:hypothetical protein